MAQHAVVEPIPPAITRKEIYYDGRLYDVTDWIPKHPGGNIISYYTDDKEDATIPIQQFHHRSIEQVLVRMKTLPNRPVENIPISQSKHNQKLTEDFQALFKDLLDQGYFEPSLTYTFVRLLEVLVLFSLAFYFVSSSGSLVSRVLAIFFHTCATARAGFAMHESGHGGFTGNSNFDRWLQLLYMNIGVGFSSTWWSMQHNRHHAMTNHVDRDSDMQSLPLLAFNLEMALENKNSNNFFIRHQAKLFFTVDTLLMAIVWKFYLNPKYAIHKKQWHQLVVLAIHYSIALYFFGPWHYLIVLWLAAAWMFGTIALSHSHLPVTRESHHWVETSLLHTVDVQPSWWCDWVMGYLNYQIEHHLFPTMPHYRQRKLTKRVRAMAEKNGIPYRCISYVDAIKATLGNLAQVSEDIDKNKTN